MCKLKTLSQFDPVLAISSEEMRAVEVAAIQSGRVTGYELMKRAGICVVEAIGRDGPSALVAEESPNAVVLCGPGNNGGDGFVIARELAQAGWRVSVCALAGAGKSQGDAALAERDWNAFGDVQDWSQACICLRDAVLVVDALFGIGLARPLDETVCEVIHAIPATSRCVAVDVPSGYATDGAGILGTVAVDADLVVTFHRPKPIHLELAAKSVPVVVADICL